MAAPCPPCDRALRFSKGADRGGKFFLRFPQKWGFSEAGGAHKSLLLCRWQSKSFVHDGREREQRAPQPSFFSKALIGVAHFCAFRKSGAFSGPGATHKSFRM